MTTIPNKSGVYMLHNGTTKQFYIGSANNLRTRKNHHFHKLREKTHANKNLQESFDKYGEKVFTFNIIELCESNKLIKREQFFIDTLNPYYNTAPTAGSMEGFIHSEETKQKISKTMSKLSPGLDFPKRLKLMDSRSMRNLVQFKDMSDEDFSKYYEDYSESVIQNEDFQSRIDEKMKGFEKDYDLSDMKFNDLESLKALCQSIVFLEIFDDYSFRLLQGEKINVNSLTLLDKLETWKNNLRKSISSLQEDLKITRKTRKSDQSQTIIQEMERIKKLANKFYEQKMAYIFCEECDMKLSSIWFLYPLANNILKLECKRCGHKTTIKTKDIYVDKNVSNKSDIPDL